MRGDVPADWSLTGITDPDGNLGRPIDTKRLAVPNRVELALEPQPRLRYSMESHPVEPSRDLLNDFLLLANATPDSVLTFARRWGVFNLCKHGVPASHNSRFSVFQRGIEPPGINLSEVCCEPLSLDEERDNVDVPLMFWEPVSAWPKFAGDFAAILRIAAKLHRGGCGASEDWQMLRTPEIHLSAGLPESSHLWQFLGIEQKLDRRHLTGIVNGLLQIADARPEMSWDGGTKSPGIILHGIAPLAQRNCGVFAWLTLQLAFAVSCADGLAICSACGAAYTPKRRPAGERRQFCPACGPRAAWRLSKRDRKSRLGGDTAGRMEGEE